MSDSQKVDDLMDVDGQVERFIRETNLMDKSEIDKVETEKSVSSPNETSSKIDVSKPYKITVDISNSLPKGVSAEEIISQICGPSKTLPKITPIVDLPPFDGNKQQVDIFVKPHPPVFKTYGFKRSKGQMSMRKHNFNRKQGTRLLTQHYKGLANAIFEIAQQEQRSMRGTHQFARFARAPLGPHRPMYIRGPRAVETPPPPPPSS